MQHACFAFFGSTPLVLYLLIFIFIFFINGVWYDLWRRREITGLGCWLCRPAISSAERFNCYIVNRASTSWKPRFARAQPGWAGWPPNRWIKRRLPCFCASACVCECVCCVFVEDVVVLALSRRPVPPSSGKTLFALADAPWMRVLKSSLPPPALAKQEQLLLGKKKKKVPGVSSAMELLCPPRVVQWGAEISQGSPIRSVAVRGFIMKSCSFGDIVADILRLPPAGPFGQTCAALCCVALARPAS